MSGCGGERARAVSNLSRSPGISLSSFLIIKVLSLTRFLFIFPLSVFSPLVPPVRSLSLIFLHANSSLIFFLYLFSFLSCFLFSVYLCSVRLSPDFSSFFVYLCIFSIPPSILLLYVLLCSRSRYLAQLPLAQLPSWVGLLPRSSFAFSVLSSRFFFLPFTFLPNPLVYLFSTFFIFFALFFIFLCFVFRFFFLSFPFFLFSFLLLPLFLSVSLSRLHLPSPLCDPSEVDSGKIRCGLSKCLLPPANILFYLRNLVTPIFTPPLPSLLPLPSSSSCNFVLVN